MRRLILCIVLSSTLLLGWLTLIRSAAAGATITVTTVDDALADDGLCSLREAVIAANTDSATGGCPSGSGDDIIEFSPALSKPAIFTLTLTGALEDNAQTGDLDIIGVLTVDGTGATEIVVDGGGADRIFDVRPAARATISGVTVLNGNPGFGFDGGGIAVRSTARSVINNSVIFSNSAASGGGIHTLGLVGINDSVVLENAGGGIYSAGGALIISNVQILSNTLSPGLINRDQSVLQMNGGVVAGNQSAGIRNVNASATLSNLVVRDNNDSGIHNNSQGSLTQLTLTNGEILSNTGASGAGILNEGPQATAVIEGTRISFNEATAGGGGINNTGNLTVQKSSLDHNLARSGAGVDHNGSALELTNVTISGNSVSDNGGGLYNRSSATLTNVTLNGNAAGDDVVTGGNIFNDGDTAQLIVVNTIIANPGPGGNCFNANGLINSSGHNLESEDSCGLTSTTDITNTNPLLGPLQDNGGSTFTHALLPGSPAIDQGDDLSCPAVDQRGMDRPQGAACDIGAFEFTAEADLSIVKQRIGAGAIASGQKITFAITISNTGPTAPISATVVDTWSPADAVVSASAPGCQVNLVAGSIMCPVSNLALESTSVPSPTLVLATSPTFSGTLTNSAQIAPNGGVSDPNPGDNISDMIHVTVINPFSFGVELSPDQTASASAGMSVTYTLHITNTGNVADTFDLSVLGNSWPTNLPTASVALDPLAVAVFSVTVDIPADALGGDADAATVTATSQGDGSKSDSATVTTSVTAAYGVALSSGYGLSGSAGGSVTYTLRITNTGNVADTFDLNVLGNSWPTNLSTASVALDPLAAAVFSVTVDIPADALGGESDLVSVEASSRGDGSKVASAMLTTSVTPLASIIMSGNDSLAGRPGTIVTYTLWITNSGNVTDTFDIELGGNLWTSTLSVPSMTLVSGERGSFSVFVEIPSWAANLETDTLTVKAVSRNDGSVSDTAVLTTYCQVAYSKVYLPVLLSG